MFQLNRTFNYLQFNIGRMLREIGLVLDKAGCRKTNDISYLQVLSRHRQIMPLVSKVPSIASDSFLAPNCTVIGEVLIGPQSKIWYNVVLNADYSPIRIGRSSSIGDCTVIDCFHVLPSGVPTSTNIGNRVKVGPGCTIISSIIDDLTTIEQDCVISEGCVIQRGARILAGSYLPPGILVR